MTKIKSIAPAEAEGELAEVYAEISERAGEVAEIYQAQSLSPRTMAAHDRLYRELMFGRNPLSRAQRELLALAVSQANDCHY